MPIFALANAGVAIELADLLNPVAIAVGLALFAGKPIGIVLFRWLSVRFGIAKPPDGVSWCAIIGGGFPAGIGFTMALFIGGPALSGDLLDASKIGIIAGSALSAIVGVTMLVLSLPPKSKGSKKQVI